MVLFEEGKENKSAVAYSMGLTNMYNYAILSIKKQKTHREDTIK